MLEIERADGCVVYHGAQKSRYYFVTTVIPLLPYQPVVKVCDFLAAMIRLLFVPLSINLLREMRSWR